MPSPHPPEFRRRAVELARQGRKSKVQPAKDLAQQLSHEGGAPRPTDTPVIECPSAR